ncbi:MAG: NAD(P)H-hydrate dehydratase [Anaerolineae bacterium]|nr:NAD(P)H-hydrate dehydratase [Anaerolineae bacterium]
MIKVVSVEQMRKIEAAADANGLSYATMMENAGRSVAERVKQIIANRPDACVTVLVGPGNNGGDGLVAGRLLAEAAQVRFYLLKTRPTYDVNFKAVQDAGLFVAYADHDKDGRLLRNMVASADVVLDALFGIGVKLPLRSEVAKVLRNVQQALHDNQQPIHPEGETINPDDPMTQSALIRPYVVAVDCPSGLDCDSGAVDKNTIPADETVTFIAAKPGLFTFPGAEMVGKLHVATVGVAEDLPELNDEKWTVADGKTVRAMLPKRSTNANKGTFGKALIVAGSANYVGAAGLASMAAYRSGVGLVTVGTPSPVVIALSGRFLEPTWLLLPHDMGALAEGAATVIVEQSNQYDALLLGSGWGKEKTTRDLLLKLLEPAQVSKSHTKRTIGFAGGKQTETETSTTLKLPPLVVDADGLNLLSAIEDWHKLLPERTIITPHPGEMGRLTKMEISEVQANRWAIVCEKATEWNVVLVLKGAHTLIADPDGRVVVLPFKTDALATAGTGDVLAGLITGLLAQGLAPFEAAVAGTYVHGLAGLRAAVKQGNTRSVIAGDVLEAIGEAITMIGS